MASHEAALEGWDASEVQARLVGDWLLGSHIGSGSFAVVWKARHRITGVIAAVKEIDLSRLNAKLRQSLDGEVSILRRISHPNIVKLIEVLEHRGRLFLVMEYCAGGDLSALLRQSGSRGIPEHAARGLLRQLAAGLRELSGRNMVHRDLKPQNLLLSEASLSARLKIADFGFARGLRTDALAETLCGSPLYMAPEILRSQRYDAKADLWSVGAVLFEMVAGSPPFTGASQMQLLRNIERGNISKIRPEVDRALSRDCRDLIGSLLRRAPVARLSFDEFFRHPFLVGDDGDPGGGLKPRGARDRGAGATAPEPGVSAAAGGAAPPRSPARLGRPDVSADGVGRGGASSADPPLDSSAPRVGALARQLRPGSSPGSADGDAPSHRRAHAAGSAAGAPHPLARLRRPSSAGGVAPSAGFGSADGAGGGGGLRGALGGQVEAGAPDHTGRGPFRPSSLNVPPSSRWLLEGVAGPPDLAPRQRVQGFSLSRGPGLKDAADDPAEPPSAPPRPSSAAGDARASSAWPSAAAATAAASATGAATASAAASYPYGRSAPPAPRTPSSSSSSQVGASRGDEPRSGGKASAVSGSDSDYVVVDGGWSSDGPQPEEARRRGKGRRGGGGTATAIPEADGPAPAEARLNEAAWTAGDRGRGPEPCAPRGYGERGAAAVASGGADGWGGDASGGATAGPPGDPAVRIDPEQAQPTEGSLEPLPRSPRAPPRDSPPTNLPLASSAHPALALATAAHSMAVRASRQGPGARARDARRGALAVGLLALERVAPHARGGSAVAGAAAKEAAALLVALEDVWGQLAEEEGAEVAFGRQLGAGRGSFAADLPPLGGGFGDGPAYGLPARADSPRDEPLPAFEPAAYRAALACARDGAVAELVARADEAEAAYDRSLALLGALADLSGRGDSRARRDPLARLHGAVDARRKAAAESGA